MQSMPLLLDGSVRGEQENVVEDGAQSGRRERQNGLEGVSSGGRWGGEWVVKGVGLPGTGDPPNKA